MPKNHCYMDSAVTDVMKLEINDERRLEISTPVHHGRSGQTLFHTSNSYNSRESIGNTNFQMWEGRQQDSHPVKTQKLPQNNSNVWTKTQKTKAIP
jgi:hypothetical protein